MGKRLGAEIEADRRTEREINQWIQTEIMRRGKGHKETVWEGAERQVNVPITRLGE